MTARPVAFGSYNFSSVNKAKLECNRIRDKYAPDGLVLEGEDDAFFRALVEEHRYREAKIGAGIEYFQVAPTQSLCAKSGNLGIWIKQIDVEKLVDFGSGGVIERIADAGGSRQERSRVDRALRGAIRPVTDRFLAEQKASGVALQSCLSGAVLDPSESIDVIHVSPRWGQLVRDFTVLVGGFSQIETKRLDHSLGEILVDKNVQDSWIGFYEERAVLGLATPEENVARPRVTE